MAYGATNFFIFQVFYLESASENDFTMKILSTSSPLCPTPAHLSLLRSVEACSAGNFEEITRLIEAQNLHRKWPYEDLV